jgi:hypothetical protein
VRTEFTNKLLGFHALVFAKLVLIAEGALGNFEEHTLGIDNRCPIAMTMAVAKA